MQESKTDKIVCLTNKLHNIIEPLTYSVGFDGNDSRINNTKHKRIQKYKGIPQITKEYKYGKPCLKCNWPDICKRECSPFPGINATNAEQIGQIW